MSDQGKLLQLLSDGNSTDEMIREAIENLSEEEACRDYPAIASAIAASSHGDAALQLLFQAKAGTLAASSSLWNHMSALSLITMVPGTVTPDNWEKTDGLLRDARRFERHALELIGSSDEGGEALHAICHFLDNLLTRTLIRLRHIVRDSGENEDMEESFHGRIAAFSAYMTRNTD